MSTAQRPQAGSRFRGKAKPALQLAAIVALIVVAGVGGAFYYRRYGDRQVTDYNAITLRTKELINVEVPERLWPRLMVTRPDVMTLVVWATKNDDACLAVLSCLPGVEKARGTAANRMLQEALHQYCPQFDTERWKGTEERDISVRGTTQRVRVATSFRSDDHKEVRVVSLDKMTSEQGTLSVYYQSTFDSRTDDEVERLLKSLQ